MADSDRDENNQTERPLVASANLHDFFREGIEGACQAQRLKASHEAIVYLAHLLSEFVRPEQTVSLRETLERSLTLLLDEALNLAPPERFEKLRSLGDGTLYVSGFFGEHLEARGVSGSFVHSIGGFAYKSAGNLVRGERSPVFSELADKFAGFVSVLAEVSARTALGARSNLGTLKLYERWLKTGNEQCARELARVGLIPSARVGNA